MRKLREDFFARDPTEVAQEILGRYLVRLYKDEKLLGQITETGAYRGGNRKGLNYGPGRLYIPNFRGYLMLAIGTESENIPSVVTIREIQSEKGNKEQQKLIYTPDELCKAFHFDESLDGMSIFGKYFWIEGDPTDPSRVVYISPKDKKMAPNCLGYFRLK